MQQWVVPLIMAAASVSAFCPMNQARRNSMQKRNMLVDPHDYLHAHPSLEALLSTVYVDVLKPAHEHTQPLWGPPDPILSAGKSIVPNPTAFADAGLTAPDSPSIPEKVADALIKSKGVNVIDPKSVIRFDPVLPGFQETSHFLPASKGLPEETPQSLILEMGEVAKMMRVVNNLPMVAFLYTCVEFFLVRPGIEVYKEELDEDRPAAAVEFLMLSGIRLAVLAAIGLVTLGLFDK